MSAYRKTAEFQVVVKIFGSEQKAKDCDFGRGDV